MRNAQSCFKTLQNGLYRIILMNWVLSRTSYLVSIETHHSLVPAFSEYFVPVVFTLFKPILLKEKRVPPTLVIIMKLLISYKKPNLRLGFQSPFFNQIYPSLFHWLFLFLFLFSVCKI